MRRTPAIAVVCALGGCGGARQAPPAPAPPPTAMPFVVETTMYAIVVVGDAPRCEPWRIVPDASTPNKGTMATQWEMDGVVHRLAIDYVRDDVQLRFDSFAHSLDGDQRESGGCSSDEAAGWNGVELAVGNARWFTSAHACEAAIAAKRPVAMDFGECGRGFWTNDDLRLPELSDDVRASSLERFKRRLRDGGEMHVIDEDDVGRLSCKEIRLPGGSMSAHGISGNMVWTEISDDGETGRVTASLRVYDEPQRWPKASNPGYGVTHAEAFVSKGYDFGDSGYALGCGDTVEVWGYEDVVEIDRNRHYFDRASCERGITSELARRAWFPPELYLEDGDKHGNPRDENDTLRVAGGLGPGVGGC